MRDPCGQCCTIRFCFLQILNEITTATFGAIEFRFGSLTSILKSRYYYLNECGNNRLNTSFFMKFYKTCDLIWNLHGFC